VDCDGVSGYIGFGAIASPWEGHLLKQKVWLPVGRVEGGTLGLQQSKPNKALRGGDESILLRARRPAEDLPGLLASGISDDAEQRQNLPHASRFAASLTNQSGN
jgi:hypothetical protein